MMLWFDRHRRLRDQLSAYVDGGLDPPAAQRLEAHLAECERCRVELEQLTATVAALKELPQADVPRSFVLSPERAAARRPLQPAPPLAFGMRMAAATVAVALAAVFVADLGDIGGGGAPGEPSAPEMLTEREADQELAAPAAGELEEATAPEAGVAETPAADDGEALYSRDADAVETPAAGEPAPKQMPDADTAEAPSAPGEAEAPAGGGIDALTAAEIALAAALGVLVAGSLALAFAGRKR